MYASRLGSSLQVFHSASAFAMLSSLTTAARSSASASTSFRQRRDFVYVTKDLNWAAARSELDEGWVYEVESSAGFSFGSEHPHRMRNGVVRERSLPPSSLCWRAPSALHVLPRAESACARARV